jgi:hypothetical protein
VETCFLCGAVVLDLPGIGTFLDPYMLDGTVVSKELRDRGWLGACHLACLSSNHAGEMWSNLIVSHITHNLRFKVVDSIGPVQVFENNAARKSVFIVRNNGWHISIDKSLFEGGTKHACGRSISEVRILKIRNRFDVVSNENLIKRISSKEGMSISEFHRVIGANCVAEVSGAELYGNGNIFAESDFLAKSSRENGLDGSVGARYRLLLPV